MFALIASLTFVSGSTIAPVRVNDLFKEADLVAIVQILSGDSEHYPVTVYKARVITAFKGAEVSEIVYFGPFVGSGVGNEYLVFLRKAKNGVKPKDDSSGMNYGPVPIFFEIMYDGYTILPSDYGCIFDGKEISQQCDYSVKLNPDQIILPKSIKTFPPGEVGSLTNYHKWVRKSVLVAYLRQVEKASRTK